MRNFSIRTKFIGAMLAVAAVNGVFTVLYFPAQQRVASEEGFSEEVAALAKTVSLGIGIGMETGDLSGVQKSMEFAQENESVRFVYLESDGEKLASFPEDLELADEEAADTLLIRGAPIDVESMTGTVYIGASRAGLIADQASQRKAAALVSLLMMALASAIAWVVGSALVKPLLGAIQHIHALAAGDLSGWEDRDSSDEVGQMSRALNRAVSGIRAALQMESVDWDEVAAQRQREQEMRASESARLEREREYAATVQHKVDGVLHVVQSASSGDLTGQVAVDGTDAVDRIGEGLNGLLGDLRRSIGRVSDGAKTLADSARTLTSVTGDIEVDTVDVSSRAEHAYAGATLVADNVRQVAAATEEMGASIREISTNAAHAAAVAREAVEKAAVANESVEALGVSSGEIGSIVSVIAGIAEKTNLLALNATIEAARAGEAGRGFAVVAHEVKELASQSARAAQEISEQIGSIQDDSRGAVEVIRQITDIITQIDAIQTSIAAAVEEQTATTSEIGRSLEEAAGGTEQISGTLQEVAGAARSTASGVERAKGSVGQLEEMVGELNELVSSFQYEERR